ncbi:hypothetical protein [Planococcus shenhongbingii]|uniref:Uncharacterized protein n=1 Tax=Planococcus shenhongbingii TaxID=3058398 RepID=A0ABT8NAG5_9BACL|nr:hypothetical protein [Planococcus sp. N017]MDN7244657.1 hypothetical protein [Planococcus sp. N017]
MKKEEDKLIAKQQSVKKEAAAIDKKLEDKKSALSAVDADIASRQDELGRLEQVIKKKKEEPISLYSGQYIVGRDIAEGRYQATNIGDGSNFVVYSSSGDLKVNTILGGGNVGYGDYIFFAVEGDLIETSAQVKLIPVE